MLFPVALVAAGQLAAQSPPELKTPRLADLPCVSGADDEVVVCGQRLPGERYRIPPELQVDRTNPLNPSWSARARDDRELDRLGNQTTGLSGNYSRWQAIECQWRAERQQIAGHPPDCTRRVRAPGD
jgi:hypothetical protein